MRLRSASAALAGLGAAGLALALTASTGSAQQSSSKYPWDPVCPWGRLSNGKGMLVRCIDKAEAAVLSTRGPAPTAPAPSASAAPAPSASSAPPATTPAAATLLALTVTPDEGALPAAEKKLKEGRAKLEACVTDNGGLDKDEGEVHVRFLVRARGRAEGVSVSKASAVSKKAADCVAHVVDRRWVGTPESPMVGATAVVKFGRVKK